MKNSDEHTNDEITILYGSQTGTAQGFAENLAKDAKEFGLNCSVFDLLEYNAKELLSSEKLVVLVISTYGEGDPPDSAIEFNGWIMSSERNSNYLNGVQFAVFGLGNRNYEFFCNMGKVMDRRFEELGAKRIYERGEGDDSASLEDDWIQWKTAFLRRISEKHGGNNQMSVSFIPSFKLVMCDQSFDEILFSPKSRESKLRKSSLTSSGNESTPFYSKLKARKDLRNLDSSSSKLNDTSSYMHYEFEIPQYMSYKTADNFGIFPANDHESVARLAKRFNYILSETFKLESITEQSNITNPFPEPVSFEQAFRWNLDIRSHPKKQLIQTMAFFAKEEEKSQLLWLCSEPGQADYEEIIRNRITIVEFFEKYSSVDLPFEVFVEVCGIIKPRYFTIASSSNVDPRVINLCVSLVQEKVSPDRTFHGLCSNYLQNISLQDESIRCSLRKSSFKLPSQKEFPIIMIAAGAGIAPMRAFLQEGKFLKDNGYTLQQWVLFFGCRYRETDFIYENEIQNSLDVGVLSKLFFASSRDQPKKIYVQDLISENSQFLWDLIKLGAYIYVCGGTSMGRQVRLSFQQIFENLGSMNSDQSQQHLHHLQLKSRYVQELWD